VTKGDARPRVAGPDGIFVPTILMLVVGPVIHVNLLEWRRRSGTANRCRRRRGSDRGEIVWSAPALRAERAFRSAAPLSESWRALSRRALGQLSACLLAGHASASGQNAAAPLPMQHRPASLKSHGNVTPL
jgi:hypothetical protein